LRMEGQLLAITATSPNCCFTNTVHPVLTGVISHKRSSQDRDSIVMPVD